MDLWCKIGGTVRVELTAADVQPIFRELLRQDITLHALEFPDGIRARFTLASGELEKLAVLVEKKNGALRILSRDGLVYWLRSWTHRPVLLFFLGVLLAASLFLPERILCVQVQGNETVPTRLILEKAEQFGLNFGASRRAVRSERIKNELLGAIDELEWVGVNTAGSLATIEVRERSTQPELEEERPRDLVAVRDGVIDTISVTQGNGKVAPGQAVAKGGILVSGLLDLGICSKTVPAQGEVYARTHHDLTAAAPLNRVQRVRAQDSVIKYSLLVGKKRINFYSDSGILMPTCGKMTMTYQIHLPGGFVLPIALQKESYTRWETAPGHLEQQEGERLLSEAMQRYLNTAMVAGTVLNRQLRMEISDGTWFMTGSYECREMIARQSEGVYLQDYG